MLKLCSEQEGGNDVIVRTHESLLQPPLHSVGRSPLRVLLSRDSTDKAGKAVWAEPHDAGRLPLKLLFLKEKTCIRGKCENGFSPSEFLMLDHVSIRIMILYIQYASYTMHIILPLLMLVLFTRWAGQILAWQKAFPQHMNTALIHLNNIVEFGECKGEN